MLFFWHRSNFSLSLPGELLFYSSDLSLRISSPGGFFNFFVTPSVFREHFVGSLGSASNVVAVSISPFPNYSQRRIGHLLVLVLSKYLLNDKYMK